MPPAGGDSRREGPNRIRIHARLIHAGTDTQLWDKAFESVVSDVFALQSQVVNAVAEGIHLRLTSTPVARPAQDFQSFDLYLRGRYYWNARTEEGLKRSVQYFQEAIDRSPRFGTAYAGLADAYNLLGDYGFVPRAEARARAVAAATKALELDDSVAEAYVSLAFIDDDEFRWDAAEERFKRALALKPGYVTGHHWYAYHLVQRARFDEAIAEGNRAVELDPLSIGTIGELGTIFLYARQYDRAIVQLEKTVQMDPNFARGRSELAKAYLLTGQRDRGRAEAEKGLATASRDVIALGDIGYVYAVTGRQGEARRIAAELIARNRSREDGTALAAAIVFAGLGDLERTFAWLDAARRPLDPQLAGFKVDPRFDRVREDPRFGKLLATVGLSQ
jgi:tetratricopeptide (TPR) repeat protein